jgi:hypothetical protein
VIRLNNFSFKGLNAPRKNNGLGSLFNKQDRRLKRRKNCEFEVTDDDIYILVTKKNRARVQKFRSKQAAIKVRGSSLVSVNQGSANLYNLS